MNGTAAPDERLMKKRALEAELETIRHQKAEVLRAIQQIAKKQKLGGPPSRGAALTHEAKIEQEQRQHAEHKRRIWSGCTKIVSELLKNSNVRLYFGEPVHRDKFPGYYETIKQPRDLGTIKGNIDVGHFKDVRGFRDDVRLCFANCRAYNPIGHPVRKFGDSASDQFEKKWENRKIEEEWDAEMERHRLAIARLEAEAKSLPDKIREVEAELQDLAAKAAVRHAAPPPGPGREMTFEEKRKLSLALGALPGERLARVLEIVAEGPSGALPPEGDEEFELDVDALDAGTLWKLQAYADSVEAETNAKAARPGAVAQAEAGAAAAAGGAPGGAQAQAAPVPAGAENAGSEEVGSKGNADSTGAADPSKKAGPRGHDMTTFVSATGPGAQPQILRNAAQKKDVQLQNEGAWANLQAPGPAAAAAAPEDAGGAAAEGDGAVPMEDDNLWTEFQGREAQEQQAEAQKKALEEAEKARQAEAAAAAERAAAEAAAAEERRRAEEAAAAAREEEEKRAREAAALKDLTQIGAEDAAAEALRQAGHGPDVGKVGLVVRQDEDDEDDLEI